jgi:hypothetical protein
MIGRIGGGAAVGALLALACGCRGEAEAQAGSAATPVANAPVANAPAAAAAVAKLAIPASWRELPEVVHAVEESLAAAKLPGAQVAAWGDPGRGCYAIQLAAKEPGRRVAQMEAGLRRGFGAPSAPAAGSAAAGSASPASAPAAANPSRAELTLSLEQPMPGALRARIRDDGESTRLAAAVCFFHARYPEQCRRHCERALASLEAP